MRATGAQVNGAALLPAGLLVEASARAIAAAFPELCALQPVRMGARGLVCAPRAAPDLAGPALARCPLPTRALAQVPGWPDPPAAMVAGWYRRGLGHLPAPAGVRELVQASGEGFGPGDHATTAMCLEAIERLPPGRAVDAGCGSGLLTQAWARARTRAGDRLRPRPASGRPGRPQPGGGGPRRAGGPAAVARSRRSPPRSSAGAVLLANLPAAAHRALRRRIVAPPAAAVLSGLRTAEAGAVADAYAALGLRPARAGRAGRLLLPRGGRVSRVWRTWSVLVLFALGTSLITPLIPLYQDRLGFGDTVVTLFLGCYVVALVPSMLSLGQLSDRIGRRRVLLVAIATLAVAQVLLITEPPLWGLLVARGDPGPRHRSLLRHLHRLPGRRRARRPARPGLGAGLDLGARWASARGRGSAG